jgi:hypothetical protein
MLVGKTGSESIADENRTNRSAELCRETGRGRISGSEAHRSAELCARRPANIGDLIETASAGEILASQTGGGRGTGIQRSLAGLRPTSLWPFADTAGKISRVDVPRRHWLPVLKHALRLPILQRNGTASSNRRTTLSCQSVFIDFYRDDDALFQPLTLY